MKKGFTLMEILAMLLVIAVVVSMAVPMFRAVRYEIKNSQAKNAAKKMAEAMLSYYQDSRGRLLTGCFTPTETEGETLIKTAATACNFAGATGIPAYKFNAAAAGDAVSQLFACGYLSYKDFVSLPYEFCTNNSTTVPAEKGTTPTGVFGKIYVFAVGVAGSGEKYQSGLIYVDGTLQVQDTYDSQD